MHSHHQYSLDTLLVQHLITLLTRSHSPIVLTAGTDSGKRIVMPGSARVQLSTHYPPRRTSQQSNEPLGTQNTQALKHSRAIQTLKPNLFTLIHNFNKVTLSFQSLSSLVAANQRWKRNLLQVSTPSIAFQQQREKFNCKKQTTIIINPS